VTPCLMCGEPKGRCECGDHHGSKPRPAKDREQLTCDCTVKAARQIAAALKELPEDRRPIAAKFGVLLAGRVES
jgi:hypothetical protein